MGRPVIVCHGRSAHQISARGVLGAAHTLGAGETDAPRFVICIALAGNDRADDEARLVFAHGRTGALHLACAGADLTGPARSSLAGSSLAASRGYLLPCVADTDKAKPPSGQQGKRSNAGCPVVLESSGP